MSTIVVSSSSSAETIEGNEYLLTEILVRLPAKHLLRLKCVSKRWNELICAPYFRRRHTLRHGAATAKVSGLILHPGKRCKPKQFKLFPFNDGRSHHSCSPFDSIVKSHNPRGICIWQSCNGLILGSMFPYRDKPCPEWYFILNPTTKDFALIPDPPLSPKYVRHGLAFDPLISPSYTVICFWRSPKSSLYSFMVYSSETRAWKARESSFVGPNDIRNTGDQGAYFNGAVHWICWRERKSFCFDVREERMRNDKMPSLPELFQPYFPAPACGHLNLVGVSDNKIEVFRLEQDYSKWVLIHKVCIQHTKLPTAFPEMFNPSYVGLGEIGRFLRYRVLRLIQDDREDSEDGDMSLLLEIPGKVIALRLIKDNNNVFYEAFGLGGLTTRDLYQNERWDTANVYIESLVCV